MATPSGLTPIYGFPYPIEDDIPDVPTWGQMFATAVENELQAVSFVPFVLPYAFSVPGPCLVASGANNYLPPFFWPVADSQTVNLLGVVTKTRSGSAVLSIDQNGSAVAGLSGVNAATTAARTNPTSTITVADEDSFSVVVSSVSGSPDGLSVTFYFQVTPG